MSGSIEQLRTSLRASDGYGNDHDSICDCRPVDVRVALDELERLQAIVKPFLHLATGIPGNWPKQCKLRIDQRDDGTEYVAYHGENQSGLGILPTIGEWKALVAAEAAKEK